MHQLLTPPQEIRTDRLLLVPVTPSDIDDLVPLFQDRHDAERAVQAAIGSRVRHGLGPWVMRLRDGGGVVGFGGATMTGSGAGRAAWQLDHRIGSTFRGRGFDTELERAAAAAVSALRGT
jgi:hypothetical protein